MSLASVVVKLMHAAAFASDRRSAKVTIVCHQGKELNGFDGIQIIVEQFCWMLLLSQWRDVVGWYGMIEQEAIS